MELITIYFENKMYIDLPAQDKDLERIRKFVYNCKDNYKLKIDRYISEIDNIKLVKKLSFCDIYCLNEDLKLMPDKPTLEELDIINFLIGKYASVKEALNKYFQGEYDYIEAKDEAELGYKYLKRLESIPYDILIKYFDYEKYTQENLIKDYTEIHNGFIRELKK